ncbi:MAG: OmpH family outer membrane protein [Bacteroidia bacterium]
MKNLSLALNAILFIAVGILFFLYLSMNKKISGENILPEKKGEPAKMVTDPAKLANAKIAYVNIDTIDTKYEYISDYSKTIRARQAGIEGQMNSMNAKFQQDYADFQQSVQAGLKSEAELKKDQAKLEQQQYELASKEKQLQNLGEEVAARQAEMMRNVSSYIAKYSNNKYDFILAYSHNISSVLYAKPDLEITTDILNGLNQEYHASKTATTPKK